MRGGVRQRTEGGEMQQRDDHDVMSSNKTDATMKIPLNVRMFLRICQTAEQVPTFVLQNGFLN